MPDIIIPNTNGTMSTYEETYREFLDDRILVLNEGIDECVIENYIMYILKWNKEDAHLPVENRKKIRMFVSSRGGDVFSSNIMIDVITQSKTPIVGIGLDLVASSAYCLFLACHERYAFENTSFLQHEGEVTIENSRSKFRQTALFFEDMEKRSKDFILSRTKMTEEFYDKMYEQELWFFADSAVEYGVIDGIIGKDVELTDIL